MSRGAVYIPSEGAESWRWLLAAPGKHWRRGYSAMELAHAWDSAHGWPSEVEAALGACEALRGTELLLALPEYETSLRGGSQGSHSDVFALGRTPAGEQVAVAVEGKANEPFGTETVSEWRRDGGGGKRERLAQLLEVLGVDDDEPLGGLRYQLLHRTAAAVLEAERFGAVHAVMLVHSFSVSNAWHEEFDDFARALGGEPVDGAVTFCRNLDGVRLYVGWATGEPHAQKLDASSEVITERFNKAVALAREGHASQVRKGTTIPYLAHLLAVSALVLEDGGDEDEAIAALLHDLVEDQGGARRLAQVRQLFGDRVAEIVDACSDTDEDPKPPWRERKKRYIEHLASTDRESVLRVSLADKLHNARAILGDLREHGDEVWQRFTADQPEEQLWYYGELARVFEHRYPGRLADELIRTVSEIESLARPARA